MDISYERKCAVYNAKKSADLKLMKCSRSFSIRYCGAACQKVHWPEHKTMCKEVVTRMAAEGLVFRMNELYYEGLDCLKTKDFRFFEEFIESNPELIYFQSKEFYSTLLFACVQMSFT